MALQFELFGLNDKSELVTNLTLFLILDRTCGEVDVKNKNKNVV